VARIRCPSCGQKTGLPPYVEVALISCPRCKTLFQASVTGRYELVVPSPTVVEPSAVRPPPEPEPEAPPGPMLTSPHRCQQCKQSINQSFGKQATTVNCPLCKYRTSIYAVLYHCPSCGTLLESPSTCEGADATCPSCKKRFRVPQNLLQVTLPKDATDDWFGFYCPNCERSVVAKREDVEKRAVCPHCLVVLAVPPLGYHVSGANASTPSDPLESLHKTAEMRCENCMAVIPKNCETCPRCGNATR
jgi:DNA-directed RNA polymerase subunit RPC12/RpoP